MFSAKTQPSQIPDEQFTFTMPVTLTAEKQADGTRKLRLKLYDGAVHSHPWWGNLAFDLKGFKLAKGKIGILYDHDTDRRVGVADNYSTDGGFEITGFALENDTAKPILADLDAGFPFEGSLRMSRDSKFRFIRDGETVVVNGKTLKGPGTVFMTTVISEGSICVFGALKNCKTDAFNQNSLTERNRNMDLNQLKAEHPDLYNQVFALGVTQGKTEATDAQKKQFGAIVKACGDDAALAAECFSQGKSELEALQMRNQKLADQVAKLSAAKAPEAPAQPKAAVTPAAAEFSDDVNHSQPVAQTAAGHPANAGGKELFSMTEDELKKKFSASADLQGRFGSIESLLAFVKAKNNGRINM